MSAAALQVLAIQTPANAAQLRSLVLVLAAITLAALLSRVSARLVLPTVVLEIVLGIAIGPDVLDIATTNEFILFLANFGLAMLFFFAGVEVVEKHVPARAVGRGSAGWLVSLVIGLMLGAGLQLAGLDAEWWIVGVALATTALGTLVPILSDSGLLPTPLGRAVMGTGVAGEFWPIVFISVFLTSTYGAAAEIVLLVVFGGVIALAAWVTLRARPPGLVRILQETLQTTGQTAVRASLLILGALVYIAVEAGFEFVLGAFAGGLVVGLVLDSPEGKIVRLRLEGIGFGLFVPLYFVVTGMTFDLESLLTASGLALAAAFLGLLFVARGAAALLWAREFAGRETLALAFFGATGLPLIVAIVNIGIEREAIADAAGASLVGAGMISVLVYPLIGTRIAAPFAGQRPAEPVGRADSEY